MQYISKSKLFEVAELLPEFSIKWASADGHWVREEKVKCTSFHSEGNTMNIKSLVTGRVTTVNLDTIVEFAGKEVIQ